MRFSTKQHHFDCGIDVHARTMSVCILDQHGERLLHRHMPARPETVLKARAPSREDLVVAVEGICTWDWLADLCARAGIPCVLGHALSMQAMHGGKAKNDKLDAPKIAGLLRGGMLPQASVSPAEMRATHDLLRRRRHLVRKRAALLAHIQQTNSQYHVPAMGTKLAYKGTRDGVAARCLEPAVQKSVEGDLALIDHYDRLLSAVELTIGQTAKQHKAHALYRLQSVPGIGKILSLVWLYEIHDITRFPRVQAVVSYCRLVKCAKASAGQRYGTCGKKSGHADLQWAVAAAAVLFRRNHPQGQKFLARLEKQHGQGTALPLWAHKWARAVYDMLTRDPVLEMDRVLNGSGSSVGEPAASRDTQGISLNDASLNNPSPLRPGTRHRT